MPQTEQPSQFQPVFLSLQSLVCSSSTLECLRTWQFPLHFLLIDLAHPQSSPHVTSATTSLRGTIVALDSSNP